MDENGVVMHQGEEDDDGDDDDEDAVIGGGGSVTDGSAGTTTRSATAATTGGATMSIRSNGSAVPVAAGKAVDAGFWCCCFGDVVPL